jgi:hypothetical protein
VTNKNQLFADETPLFKLKFGTHKKGNNRIKSLNKYLGSHREGVREAYKTYEKIILTPY